MYIFLRDNILNEVVYQIHFMWDHYVHCRCKTGIYTRILTHNFSGIPKRDRATRSKVTKYVRLRDLI